MAPNPTGNGIDGAVTMRSAILLGAKRPETEMIAPLSLSGPDIERPKRIADHMVTAPFIPFPVGFGANLAGSATISVSGSGDRGALFSISGLVWRQNEKGKGQVRCRPRSSTGSAKSSAASNCP